MHHFFKDIFNYHHYYNQMLAHYLENHGEKVSKKSLQLFSHAINAHQIWNARILLREPVVVHQINSLASNRKMDEANLEDTVFILDSKPLHEQLLYKNSRGEAFENSIQEILFHIANHFTHHRAQIMSDLRQGGIEPLVTDYIFFKRKN